jgi:hypothetical protein
MAQPGPDAVAAFVAEVHQVLTQHGPGATAYVLIGQAVDRHGRAVVQAALDFWKTDNAVFELLKTL